MQTIPAATLERMAGARGRFSKICESAHEGKDFARARKHSLSEKNQLGEGTAPENFEILL